MSESGVEIVEVGPRDGLQNEDRTLPVATRVKMLRRLVVGGTRRVEAVSFVHPDRVPQMAGAEEVLDGLAATGVVAEDVRLIGLVLNDRGAQRAAATSCREINVVVPVTDEFCRRNQGRSVEGMLEQAAAATQTARAAEMGVSVTLAVAFGCPFSGTVGVDRVAEVLDRVLAMGVDEVAFADTIGVGVPSQVTSYAALLPTGASTPGLRYHFHNTRNTGYANAWTAATLGRPVALDSSVGGFGGCPFAPAATGNIATEDLLYLLTRGEVPVTGPVQDLLGLTDVSAWLSKELDSSVDALLGRAGGFGGVGEEPS
ncbi:hydroxymethylglutaryl-CoA lyase [Marmoricola endophyticus]|uniref:Hydroxymethylglutaryl-CoA lyase n=1 Tax=Marmoricola endophyticus TaxID=2040280 RepID=A0A917BEE9_9ACTN|nr:hydroxymethylglutaryl-CoA lyase [Marmoricola endophyticus]GGF39391.1 hydroxymethylglutaryl-CoA lyase [Marmoricola endophyticus]